ncbi:MAG: helix-turn-helix transcriptional regulator [Eubacterium sp.]|nr:helix-turn-helix transcriptional regulator [Eubacterium sp.]
MKFDENLRELRKEKGYSQEELAYKLNVTRQTVSKWENGSAMPDLKKLTELAEFFGVSMDALLGLDVDGAKETDSGDSTFEAYVQYTEQKIAALEESRNQDIRKKFTILICLFTAVMLLLFVCFINYSNGIRNELNSLSINYSYLYNQVNSINYSGGDNYWESKSVDVTASLLSVDPEKPYIVQMQLKYSPMSYAKGSKVYFSVPKEDKNIERLEAEEINGEFVLTTNIDITVAGEYYFFLDDGNEIVKEELYIYPEDLYCSFGENHLNYSVSKVNTFDKKYYFEIYNEDNKLFWSGIASDKLVSAQFIVESSGKEIFSKELEIIQNDSLKGTFIKLSNYTVEIINFSNLRAYVLATDELGIVYKHYINLESADIWMDSPYYYGEEYNVIIFDVAGKGKVKVGEAEVITEEKVSELNNY